MNKKEKTACILAIVAIIMLITSNIITAIINKKPNHKFYIETVFENLFEKLK